MRFTNLWLKCFSGTPAPMIHWPCVQCGATTHYPENFFFCVGSMHEPERGPQPLPTSTSTGGQNSPPMSGNVSHPGQPSDSRLTMAHPSHQRPQWTCYAFNCSICHRSSCSCVKYVVLTTVPGSALTRAVPFSKSTPWILLRLFILKHELSDHPS